MIKIGIIGCGRIADEHADQIRRIQGCEIVGACDREELMAKQFHERFKVKHYFSDVNELLNRVKPDVVHITTPPQSHFELGKICLEAGCHVYIEKPFTIDAAEAAELIKSAMEKNVKITAGHCDQFTHAARSMRDLIQNGYLGGPPVHMESYFCYDLGNESYAKSLFGDKNHWVRKLPGKLMHNVISHGIAKISEFLSSDDPEVIAHGFTSPFLKKITGTEIVDELRVIINDNNCNTAYFTFSSQMRPTLHHFRIYGPQNGIIVDHNHQTVIKVRGTKYKSYLDMFVPSYIFAKQYLANSMTNINHFLKNDFHMKSGMKFLIESFYRSINDDSKLPISYREIILTAKIMDEIFKQIGANKGEVI